jgi:hypothetical protein
LRSRNRPWAPVLDVKGGGGGTEGWSTLNNEDLHNLYSFPNMILSNDKIKEDERGTHGGKEKCLQNFGRKPKIKRQPLSPRCR